MCPASAQVTFHAPNYLGFGRLRISQQQTISIENHTRCAETALKSIVLYERFLNWMQFTVACQSFDGKNLFSFDASNRNYA
jgi:hypothetical protein